VFVIGGRESAPNSQTPQILAISPNGAVTTAGALPRPLSDVSAVALGPHILLAGGRDATGNVDGAVMTLSPR
jgi:hypothetical protein